MSTHARCARALAIALAFHVAPLVAQNSDTANGALQRVSPNDNRTPAGTLVNGALNVRLEARTGRWFPDGDDQPGVTVNAFAAEGGPLQAPGPMIRVRAGTEVHVDLRNRLASSFVMHGLYSRPASEPADPVVVPAGDTRQFVFIAREPGTYFYWASANADDTVRQPADTIMSGAIIVDPHYGPALADRVLVIQHWTNGRRSTTGRRDPEARRRFVINGRSWPQTERLSYSIGDVVRIRVINISGAVHPMHLHGFYFNVDSRGDERHDDIFPDGSSAHSVVTERLDLGRTFTMTWKPTRVGNWLFHCHDSEHLEYGGRLDTSGPEVTPHHHVANHALEMMAGPVMGITISGKSTERHARETSGRSFRLVARVDEGNTTAEPSYAYALDSSTPKGTAQPLAAIGPTLLLKRGEPVNITIINQLPEDTSVHWHGIELESYFDGVPGFAGAGQHIAPPIPPGGSFVARFTPPRSGTFIYHSHVDDTRQQQAGLSGPLLVVDDPRHFDQEHNVVLMVTTPRKEADQNAVLINGSLTPTGREIHVGEHYRLRLVDLHAFRTGMRMRLVRGDTLLAWRSVAKDGMDLPVDQRVERPAEVLMGNGETYDFDFVPMEPGDLRFEVAFGNGLLASMPLRATATGKNRTVGK